MTIAEVKETAGLLQECIDRLHSSIPRVGMEAIMRRAVGLLNEVVAIGAQAELAATPVPLMTDERYEIKNEELVDFIKAKASDISTQVPEGYGFALYVFEFGERGGMFYASSARRPDVVRVMLEWIAREERLIGTPIT